MSLFECRKQISEKNNEFVEAYELISLKINVSMLEYTNTGITGKYDWMARKENNTIS